MIGPGLSALECASDESLSKATHWQLASESKVQLEAAPSQAQVEPS
jgi:hypothetical protein